MRSSKQNAGTRSDRAAVERLPLSALLSQALVTFTIECDNKFEHQMPHRTSNYGSTGGLRRGLWLVSIVMWWNCMRFVGEAGVRAAELVELALAKTNLNGMVRWGYVTVETKGPRRDWMIRATVNGRTAREVWEPVPAAIEERWRARFGKGQVARLRKSLAAIVEQIPFDLPDCLPILGYGMWSKGRALVRPVTPAGRPAASSLKLPALLSQVLLAFALTFEKKSDVSLAIAADVVRVLDEAGAAGSGFAAARWPEPAGSRAKIARLAAEGGKVTGRYARLAGAIEERWKARFGQDTIATLREALERLAGEPLLRGLEPYPDGWRASVRRPSTLPHYPMTLHRGGYPDGS